MPSILLGCALGRHRALLSRPSRSRLTPIATTAGVGFRAVVRLDAEGVRMLRIAG
jgi:hypothetical protein